MKAAAKAETVNAEMAAVAATAVASAQANATNAQKVHRLKLVRHASRENPVHRAKVVATTAKASATVTAQSAHRVSAVRPCLRKLQARKPVVVLGDFNVALRAYDCPSPKTSRNKVAAFCDAERDNFANLLLGPAPSGVGLVDAWREAHPKAQLFTYYSIMRKGRLTGKGWRIDTTLVSPALMPRVRDPFVRTTFPLNVDHMPVGITLAE